MTEIQDGTHILYSHVDELFKVNAIDVQEKQRLQDEIRAIEEDLEHHYEQLAE